MNMQNVGQQHMRDSTYQPPERTLIYLEILAHALVIGATLGFVWWRWL